MSAEKSRSSQIDVRGFRYALEPLQRKHEWQLAALETQLGHRHRDLKDSREALSELQSRHRQQLAWAHSLDPRRALDPQSRQRLLACLVQLDEEIRQAGLVVQQRLQAVQESQAACNQKRRKIEALDKHREASLKEFAEEQGRIQFAQLDRDWMAHSSVAQDRVRQALAVAEATKAAGAAIAAARSGVEGSA